MRRSSFFFLYVFFCLLVIGAIVFWSEREGSRFIAKSPDLQEITAVLRLTDISFSHDARYTRHPSQADLFSAFQDYPGSIDHFPSGSVTAPPDFSLLSTRITVRKR
ncbi:MAG: hypothetical protein HZA17_09760 [Nitrospirae bacterium]|nr:hypothetical protein [Nitrospirota bacterium]